MREKAQSRVSLGRLAERRNGWLGGAQAGFEPLDGELKTGRSRLSERSHKNLFTRKFISNSKRSIFENRIESVKSRAWERNGPFGE